jgi:hypothetical protein
MKKHHPLDKTRIRMAMLQGIADAGATMKKQPPAKMSKLKKAIDALKDGLRKAAGKP